MQHHTALIQSLYLPLEDSNGVHTTRSWFQDCWQIPKPTGALEEWPLFLTTEFSLQPMINIFSVHGLQFYLQHRSHRIWAHRGAVLVHRRLGRTGCQVVLKGFWKVVYCQMRTLRTTPGTQLTSHPEFRLGWYGDSSESRTRSSERRDYCPRGPKEAWHMWGPEAGAPLPNRVVREAEVGGVG